MRRTGSGYAARAVDDLPTLWDGFATLVGAGRRRSRIVRGKVL
jgi:hypothetical protein